MPGRKGERLLWIELNIFARRNGCYLQMDVKYFDSIDHVIAELPVTRRF